MGGPHFFETSNAHARGVVRAHWLGTTLLSDSRGSLALSLGTPSEKTGDSIDEQRENERVEPK
jgi:hypothetical protein